MSYLEIKQDLLDFISNRQWLISNKERKCFIFTSRDIYHLYDGCESTKDASDALNSLWKYDGELARIEVSKIDKSLIADRESVPIKGYFYALAKYAPPGFEMHEKFKLNKKNTDEKINLNVDCGFSVPDDCIDNKTQKGTEMNSEEKEYVRAVWSRELEGAETYLYRALNNPVHEFSIDSFADVEEYMTELRRLQDEYVTRYRMAKKQLEALK